MRYIIGDTLGKKIAENEIKERRREQNGETTGKPNLKNARRSTRKAPQRRNVSKSRAEIIKGD